MITAEAAGIVLQMEGETLTLMAHGTDWTWA